MTTKTTKKKAAKKAAPKASTAKRPRTPRVTTAKATKTTKVPAPGHLVKNREARTLLDAYLKVLSTAGEKKTEFTVFTASPSKVTVAEVAPDGSMKVVLSDVKVTEAAQWVSGAVFWSNR